jgi:hypothetical protein
MKNKRLLLVATVILANCSKPSTPPASTDPTKATLTLPAQNAACTSGNVVSATQSTILFTWGSTANTDSYELDIKNLLTNAISTQTSTTNQLSVTLLRNTPYAWYVISKSNRSSTTAQSDTWKFYNAGLGNLSYPPFPATITTPIFGQTVSASTGTINLTWTGSSIDNNIVGYDVYFGTSSTPPLLKSAVTDMFLNSVTITKGNTYYWKVITKDALGNTSDSGVYQFVAS